MNIEFLFETGNEYNLFEEKILNGRNWHDFFNLIYGFDYEEDGRFGLRLALWQYCV